jgi:Holliday junction resolvase RusA-like endonuclease
MKELQFSISHDPVPAARPRVTTRGTFYPKQHALYKAYLDNVLDFVEHTSDNEVVCLEVRMLFVKKPYATSDWPTSRTDVDNLSKLPMDSMTKSKLVDGETHRFWMDDSLVVHLVSMKRFCREGEEPHTKVRVIPIEGNIEDHVDKAFNS